MNFKKIITLGILSMTIVNTSLESLAAVELSSNTQLTSQGEATSNNNLVSTEGEHLSTININNYKNIDEKELWFKATKYLNDCEVDSKTWSEWIDKLVMLKQHNSDKSVYKFNLWKSQLDQYMQTNKEQIKLKKEGEEFIINLNLDANLTSEFQKKFFDENNGLNYLNRANFEIWKRVTLNTVSQQHLQDTHKIAPASPTATKNVYIQGYGNVTMRLHHRGDLVVNIANSKESGGGTYWSGPHGHFFEGNANSTINPIMTVMWMMQTNNIAPITLSWKEGWPGTYGRGSAWAPYGHIGVDVGYRGNNKLAVPETEWVGQMNMSGNYKQVIFIDPANINKTNPFYYGIGHSTYINGGTDPSQSNETFIGSGFGSREIRVQGATYVNPQNFSEQSIYVSPNTPLILNYNNGYPMILFISPQGFPLGGQISVSDYNKIKSRSRRASFSDILRTTSSIRNSNSAASGYNGTTYNGSVTASAPRISTPAPHDYKRDGDSYISSKHLPSDSYNFYKSRFDSNRNNYGNSSQYSSWKRYFDNEVNQSKNKTSGINYLKSFYLTGTNYNTYYNDFVRVSKNWASIFNYNNWKNWVSWDVLKKLQSDGYRTVDEKRLPSVVANEYKKDFKNNTNGKNWKSIANYVSWKKWFYWSFSDNRKLLNDGKSLISSYLLSSRTSNYYLSSLQSSGGKNTNGTLMFNFWKSWINRDVLSKLKNEGQIVVDEKRLPSDVAYANKMNFINTNNGANWKTIDGYKKWYNWFKSSFNDNAKLLNDGKNIINSIKLSNQQRDKYMSNFTSGNGRNTNGYVMFNNWKDWFYREMKTQLKVSGIDIINNAKLVSEFSNAYQKEFLANSSNFDNIDGYNKWATYIQQQLDTSIYKNLGINKIKSSVTDVEQQNRQINEFLFSGVNYSSKLAYNKWLSTYDPSNLIPDFRIEGLNYIDTLNLNTITSNYYKSEFLTNPVSSNYVVSQNYNNWVRWFNDQTNKVKFKNDGINFINSIGLLKQDHDGQISKFVNENNGANYSTLYNYNNWKKWIETGISTQLKNTGTVLIRSKRISTAAKNHYVNDFVSWRSGTNYKKITDYFKWRNGFNGSLNTVTHLNNGIKFVNSLRITSRQKATTIATFKRNSQNYSCKFDYDAWVSKIKREFHIR